MFNLNPPVLSGGRRNPRGDAKAAGTGDRPIPGLITSRRKHPTIKRQVEQAPTRARKEELRRAAEELARRAKEELKRKRAAATEKEEKEERRRRSGDAETDTPEIRPEVRKKLDGVPIDERDEAGWMRSKAEAEDAADDENAGGEALEEFPRPEPREKVAFGMMSRRKATPHVAVRFVGKGPVPSNAVLNPLPVSAPVHVSIAKEKRSAPEKLPGSAAAPGGRGGVAGSKLDPFAAAPPAPTPEERRGGGSSRRSPDTGGGFREDARAGGSGAAAGTLLAMGAAAVSGNALVPVVPSGPGFQGVAVGGRGSANGGGFSGGGVSPTRCRVVKRAKFCTGVVEIWHPFPKNFGFVIPDERHEEAGKERLFTHIYNLKDPSSNGLTKGDRVRYTVEWSREKNKYFAQHVQVIRSARSGSRSQSRSRSREPEPRGRKRSRSRSRSRGGGGRKVRKGSRSRSRRSRSRRRA